MDFSLLASAIYKAFSAAQGGLLSRIHNGQRESGGNGTIIPGYAPVGAGPTTNQVIVFNSPSILQISSEGAPNPQGVILTLSYNIDGDFDLTTIPDTAIYTIGAHVIWGNGKGKHEVYLDASPGQSVTFSASSIEIIPFIRTRATAHGALLGPPVTVSADLSYGNVGTGNARFTDTPEIIAENAVGSLTKIPNFARTLTLADNGSSSGYNVFLSGGYNPTGLDPTESSVLSFQVQAGTQIDIPSGMLFYQIQNIDTVLPHSVYPLFGLSL